MVGKEKIGVVGAGLMGPEIALVFALAGHEVMMVDQSRKKSSAKHWTGSVPFSIRGCNGASFRKHTLIRLGRQLPRASIFVSLRTVNSLLKQYSSGKMSKQRSMASLM